MERAMLAANMETQFGRSVLFRSSLRCRRLALLFSTAGLDLEAKAGEDDSQKETCPPTWPKAPCEL